MITDQQARAIACEWHGGASSALYALCSTGALGGAIDGDIRWELDWVSNPLNRDEYLDTDRADLTSLLEYVHANGPRGPVEGWSSMPWEEDC